MPVKTRTELRLSRHTRLRKKLAGTAERPRLAVFRSLKHVYAQIIDDTKGHTLLSASSQDEGHEGGGNAVGAKVVGARLAEKAKAAGIESVVFDRGGFAYHGRVQALADAAREGGLNF